MKSYFDTSVLFPSLVEAHPHHEKCRDVFQNVKMSGESICLSTHTYAELYSNLSRFPLGDKIHLQTVVHTIVELGNRNLLIELRKDDYEAAMRRSANAGLVGGVIYDALHLQAALKAGAGRLYTANIKDFARLMTPEVSIELMGVNF